MSDTPLVMIIGDSISMGYTPHVKETLADKVRVERHEGNGGDSHNVLSHFDTKWLPAMKDTPDLIHINCGLHDLRLWTDRNEYQVPIEDYRRNIRQLAEALAATGAKIIWATTTPVLDDAPGMNQQCLRVNKNVDAYNAIALDTMTAAGFAIDDLNALVKELGPEKLITQDGVHFTDDGYAQLGAEVARVIAETLAV